VTPDTSKFLDRYWSDFLGTPVGDTNGASEESEIEIVTHQALGNFHGIFLFQRKGRTIVSCPESRLRFVAVRLRDTALVRSFSGGKILSALGGEGLSITGPTVLNYVDAASLSVPPGPDILELDRSDLGEVKEFLGKCEKTDVETSGLSTETAVLFGLRVGGEIVTVSGYDVWGGVIGNLTALTRKSHQGNGYAQTALGAAARVGTSKGLIMQFRVGVAFEVSQHLSRRLGFEEYARSMTIEFGENKTK